MIWLGPWICPALIAALFILWGGWVLRSQNEMTLTLRGLAIFVVGAVLGLIAFMQPAAVVMMREGADSLAALSQYTPGQFWWSLFVLGFVMMAAGFRMTKREEFEGNPKRESGTNSRKPRLVLLCSLKRLKSIIECRRHGSR